jgi:hypothetical protein
MEEGLTGCSLLSDKPSAQMGFHKVLRQTLEGNTNHCL